MNHYNIIMTTTILEIVMNQAITDLDFDQAAKAVEEIQRLKNENIYLN